MIRVTRDLTIASLLLLGCSKKAESAQPAPSATPPSPASAKPSAPPVPSHFAGLRRSSGAVSVGCGFLFVDNESPTPYSVLLPAVRGSRVPGEFAFELDGVPVEVTTTTAKEVRAPTLRGKDLLDLHARWEADYLRKENGWQSLPMDPSPTPIDVGVPEVDGMAWGLKLPKPIDFPGRQVNHLWFVTAALGETILVLGSQTGEGQPASITQGKLTAALRTLKRLPEPLDLDALSAQVHASGGTWEGCPRPK